ncbi:sodium-dependent proline transporter-like isoform X5 [Paroedura picta]|uniref:sodium-dependent proline transporter-like isoform X5 n=1 Tax=Paroedura picta TaxID=143630 RepID=UPI00405683FC
MAAPAGAPGAAPGRAERDGPGGEPPPALCRSSPEPARRSTTRARPAPRHLGRQVRVPPLLPGLLRGAGQRLALPVSLLSQWRGSVPHPLRPHAALHGPAPLPDGAQPRPVWGGRTHHRLEVLPPPERDRDRDAGGLLAGHPLLQRHPGLDLLLPGHVSAEPPALVLPGPTQRPPLPGPERVPGERLQEQRQRGLLERAGAGSGAQLRPGGPRRSEVAPGPVPAAGLAGSLPVHPARDPQLGQGVVSPCQVVYFTATFPYLVIVVLIIRGATLEGSIDGVRFYLSADWSRLHSAQVWSDAASQIFYSLGIGFGGLLSMASYNKFDNNVIRDTLVIALGNCGTSFFAGFAIFSILGHMAWRKKVPVGEVAETGPGLAFVAYPEALALLPGSAFWSVLFFLMLFTLGIDTLTLFARQFGNMEGIVTAVMDEFPSLRDFRRKALFLGGLCLAFYCLGLLLVTEGGIYWFTLLDAYSTSFGLIVIVLFMCLGMAFFYGVNQFCQDIVDMIRLCPPWCSRLLLCFKACWVVVTPGLLLFTLFYIFLDLSSTRLHYGPYQYPRWGEALGVCLGVVTCVQIPLWAGVALCKESGTLADRFRKAIHPLNSWRATNGRDLSHHVIDVPYTVNLTDHDSLGAWQLQGSSEA